MYDAAYVGHLGAYRCEACGHARPPLDVAARAIETHGLDGVSFSLETPAGNARVRLALPGLYNVYNALAAASLALALGASLDVVVDGLERFTGAFGRFERFVVGDKRVLLLLVKNPAGANEAIRTLENGSAPATLVVALNDRIADGRDVSWIWDVDFEPLLDRAGRIVVTGERAAELALRFTYGGLPAGTARGRSRARRRARPGSRADAAGRGARCPADVHRDARAPGDRDEARADAPVLGGRGVIVRVGHLYPEYLNIYADRGNIAVLRATRGRTGPRARARARSRSGRPSSPARTTSSTSAAARIASRR